MVEKFKHQQEVKEYIEDWLYPDGRNDSTESLTPEDILIQSELDVALSLAGTFTAEELEVKSHQLYEAIVTSQDTQTIAMLLKQIHHFTMAYRIHTGETIEL